MENNITDISVKKTKLELIDEKIKQLQNKKQAMIQREKTQERKLRTKRLIEMGAITEKYFDISSPEELKILFDKNINYINSIKSNNKNTTIPKAN